MVFTAANLQPTVITDGLGGNTFDSRHLARTYGIDHPHDFSDNMRIATAFSATDKYNNKPLVGMTEAKGKIEYATSNQFTWKLKGYQTQKYRITDVIETSTQPGIGGTTFAIVLDKPWVKYPDIIQGEHNEYPLEIVSPVELQDANPTPYGNGHKYIVRLMEQNNSKFFPLDLIQVGKEFIKTGSSVPDESNQDFGTVQFNSIFELRSQTGNAAEGLSITDRALRIDKNAGPIDKARHWRVPFLAKDNKTYMGFMLLAEAEVWNTIYKDIEWGLMFGKKLVRTGPQGYLRRFGPGMRQQLEYSHILTHNGNLTLSQLEDWLLSIYTGRTDATAAQRAITLMTGEMGAKMFTAMVESDLSQFLTVADSYLVGNKTDPRHLSYGIQFTRYLGKNGLEVTVAINPAYDNPEFCPQKHPIYTDKCLDSWRMDILDFGIATNSSDGMVSDNIVMVKERYADTYMCSTGKWTKSGFPKNEGQEGFAGGVSGYTFFIERSFGLWIKDITRCGVIKLEVDA